jgi:hypothetical protein
MSIATVSFVLKHQPDSTIHLGTYTVYNKPAVSFVLKQYPDFLVLITQ